MTKKGTIAIRGSAPGKAFALISVSFPQGNTCTASNGTRTLTAKSSNGLWLFPIPEAGDWTVTSGSRSTTVSITSRGQIASASLASFYILKDGVSNPAFVKSGKGTGGTSGSYITFKGSTAAWSPEGSYYYPEPVDVSAYSKLYFEGYASKPNCNEEDQYPITYFYADGATKDIGTTEQVLSLDISKIDGECEIGIYTMSRHSSLEGKSVRATIYAKNIWLE